MSKQPDISPEGQKVVVVAVPLELFTEVFKALEELPARQSREILNKLTQLQPQEATINKG